MVTLFAELPGYCVVFWPQSRFTYRFMKFLVSVFLWAGFTAGVLHAGPEETAVVAAVKLAEAPNYGWVSDISDDARSYTIDGKTNLADPADYSLVNMPLVSALRRNMAGSPAAGGGRSDNHVNAIFSGDEKLVIEVGDTWKTPEELQSAPSPGADRARGRVGSGPGASRGRRGRPSGTSGGGDRPAPVFSNLQLTLSRPHEELSIIVAGYTDLKVEGAIVSGTLTETGAKLLLVHPGQKEITPLQGSGTFRLWIKDGALVKYEVRLEGTLAVVAGGNRREIQVHQTAVTQLRDVGTTKFDVPAEAKKKLGV